MIVFIMYIHFFYMSPFNIIVFETYIFLNHLNLFSSQFFPSLGVGYAVRLQGGPTREDHLALCGRRTHAIFVCHHESTMEHESAVLSRTQ